MNEQLKAADKKYIMGTYARFDAAFVRGSGARLYDENGCEYIDMSSGIGVASLGHANPEIAAAIAAQALKICHTSNLYYNPVCIELAEKLCRATGMDKAFFCNSGAEADEGAIKLARKYGFDKYGPGRSTIVTLEDSFHGRTVTTLSATGQDKFHKFFDPFTEGFIHIPAKKEALEALPEGKICAFLLEPIQGEGGVKPLEEDFVKAVYEYAQKRDILVMFDEVQSGVGRTGRFLASSYFEGGTPDVITLAKGLGGGLPIGAFACSAKTADVMSAGTHGSTFGGNPVCCAAANVVLDTVTSEGFLGEVEQKGKYIKDELLRRCPDEIESIRGRGLMLGVTLKTKDPAKVVARLLEKRVAALTAKGVLRLLPPLVITKEELKTALCAIEEVLKEEAAV